MRNRKYWIAALCLGLMTVLGGNRLLAADSKRESNEVKARMEAEGWQQVSDGVFERRLGPNKVEHLGYGREGFAWTLGELSRKLEGLRAEYESYPSENLAQTIDSLSQKIAEAKQELWNLDQGSSQDPSSLVAPIAGAPCSDICYGATADAYPLTSTQGVAAVADAKFNSTCGYSGDTYAYAYARATLNGTTTTITQSDPHTGTSVTSHAAASVYGSGSCYSEASSYAQSSALGISYSTSDTNSSCPPVEQTCNVTISGTTYEYFLHANCRSRTWTASVSGCTPSTYQWTIGGTVVGTGSTYTRSICYYDSSFTLALTVNGTGSDTHDVWVEYDPYAGGCGPNPCP